MRFLHLLSQSWLCRKRQRTAALQDASRVSILTKFRQVLECGSPLPLFGRLPASFVIAVNLVLLLTSVVRASPRAELDYPEAELATFEVADGFEVNLFASELDGVIKPIQMRFDFRGRLWVIGSTVYPQLEPGQVPNDKVLILEDRDGDGRCDHTSVFADGLMIPTGIELTKDGAYIGHGSELLYLRDTDGDGKADERKVVLRGFGTGDNHQNINSFLWGPGGELWMSQGLHILSKVETPWGLVQLNQAGIWRLWPRRLKLEGFYGSEHEPQNPWGFVFTDWGEPIVLAGNNSSPIYPVPGLVSRHRDLGPTLIWKNGNGRKTSGGDIVGTSHFPPFWQGALILGGYLNNAVWALKIIDDGAGFRLEDLPPLIKSSSRSFRPVDVKFGPDGALYVCDWYNPIIGHYQTSFRHPDRDKKHGRIWRMTAKNRPLTSPPKLTRASAEALVRLIESPDRWTRQFSKRALADWTTEEVKSALAAFVARPDITEHALKEALGVYQSHELVEPTLLERLCHAKEAGARAYAAGVIGNWADRLDQPLSLLRPLASDENARVRLQAVVACSYIPKAEAMEVAAAAADFPTDSFLDYAFQQTVFALKPVWLPALQQGKLDLGNKVSRLAMLVRSDGSSDTRITLRKLLASPALARESRPMFLQTLAEIGTPSDWTELLKECDAENAGIVLSAIAATARVRNATPSRDAAQQLSRFFESQQPETKAEAIGLAGVWKLESYRSLIENTASDNEADLIVRRAAVEALALFGDAARIAALTGSGLPRLQSAALAALSRLDLDKAASFAKDALANGKDGQAVTEILTAFLQRKNGPAALASALASTAVSRETASIGLRLLNSSGRRDEKLAEIFQKAQSLRVQRFSGEDLSNFIAEIRARGNVTNGEAVFRRPELGCLACHSVNGEGGVIGPNLSSLGTAQPIDFIIGAILDPQKEIKEGYTSVSITTKDSDEYQGYLVRETAEEVTIRDVLQNREVRLARSAIKEKRQNGSVMPSGLADTLSREEFRDLVRYLSELGKTH